MKTKIFLAMGVMASIYGYGQQTYFSPAGAAGTSGVESAYMGSSAGLNSTSEAVRNVFIGTSAGISNEIGDNNVYIGYNAGASNVSGIRNVFIGSSAGSNNTTSNSIFIGNQAGLLNNNIEGAFIGSRSGRDNLGEGNCFFGHQSGLTNQNGNSNCFYGSHSGENSTGSENVIIGKYAGTNAGSKNVLLGYYSGYYEYGDNRLYIANSSTSDPLIYGEFDSDTDSTVEGTLKFNAQKVGIGFAPSTMGFGSFPGMTGIANADDYRLFVRGGILAEEVRIRLQTQWADYVFNDDYSLLPLEELQRYIEKEKHLPNMPSAKEVGETGIEIGNIVTLQQEKIEELTLYIIEQNERNKEQEQRIETLEKQVQLLLNKQ